MFLAVKGNDFFAFLISVRTHNSTHSEDGDDHKGEHEEFDDDNDAECPELSEKAFLAPDAKSVSPLLPQSESL